MGYSRKNSWKLRLGIFLFLTCQLMAPAHAVEFGDTPHEHNGHTCVALSAEDQPGVVAHSSTLVANVVLSTVVAVAPNTPDSTNNVALPPAIGPPLSI